MTSTDRKLRRAALLLFPKFSLDEETLDRIVEEGFTDIGAGVAVTPTMKDQGFSFEESQQLAEMCEPRGLGFVAFTGYMKYQYQLVADEPQRLMLLAKEGHVQDLDGLRVRWLCPFRPENKTHYHELLMEICKWPAAREIHLNDEASLGFSGGQIGCYCDYCQEQFAEATGAAPPTVPDWDDPLWYQWLEARFDNWVGMHTEFRDAIKNVRPDIQVGIQHSPYMPERIYNAWESGVCLAREARAQDLIATDPYHYNHADGIRFRPHRRILSETTRSLVGACIDREVVIYPQGFMPPSQAVPMGKQDGVLAGVVPFALGGDTVMPFTYELMKIIPGFFEGLDQARKLLPHFQLHRPYAYATMLMPQQSEIYGHYETNWAGTKLSDMADAMFRTGAPWRWFWDQRLDDVGDQLTGPLVLPEVHCLTQGQLDTINEVAERGEGLLWIGNTPQEPWAGKGQCSLPNPVSYGTYELELNRSHSLAAGLTVPVVLSSKVGWDGPEGEVIGTIDGRPALTLVEKGARREAWLAGMPAKEFLGNAPGSATAVETGSIELLRRLLGWVSGERPLVCLDPFPPLDDYRTLRPADRRAVPTIELLPMVSDRSVLAIVFPYTPVACETSLVLSSREGARIGSVTELWQEEDWTDRLQQGEDGSFSIPLRIPGDCELLALLIEFGEK